MPSTSRLLRFAAALIAAVLTVAGCSRVGIAYNTGDFLLKGYAKDYLDLTGEQLTRWDPVLKGALARHRVEELPYLAAFFDRVLTASQLGFDERNMACLNEEFLDLYRRQARFAVTLATPLLVELTPAQHQRLERRFQDEAAEDRAELAEQNSEYQRLKRARRYVKSIEDWTGPLNAGQQLIVGDVTSRMPGRQSSLLQYRTEKREQLIAMLKSGADEQAVERFMTAWLVDFSDLPPEINQAGEQMKERIAELFVRLGASLDAAQRERLEKRLRSIRDDLLNLQKEPRLAPLTC